ncbi:MAG: hypothetical protein FWG67_10390 [Defluviitaleaceae bacterium]|nr:hypothetical protein [Defluviitaleaceae bacterium]
MKFQNIFRLQKLYYLFFIRQVLSMGILKEKLFRIVIAILLLGLFGMTFWFNYNLFDGSFVLPEINWASHLIRTRIIEVVTWTSGVFLFIKLLFLKKGSFLQLTTQLPITNRERSISLLLFELLMVLFIVSLIGASYVAAFVFRFGVMSIFLLITISFFTCVTLYLILQLSYVIVSYILDVVKLTKLKTLAVYLFLSASFIWINQNTVVLALRTPVELENFHWSTLFLWLNDEIHFLAPLLFFFFSTSILVFLGLLIPMHTYIEERAYANLKLPFLKKSTLLNLYLLQLIRRVENYVTVVVSCALFFFFLIYIMTAGMINPFNAMMFVALLGLYIYMQTDKIRVMAYKLNYRAMSDYTALILSQVIYLFFISIPLFLLHLIVSDTLFPIDSYLNIILNLFITILVTTYAGILFPAKKENPFSPLIGTMLAVIVLGSLFYISAILNLSHFGNVLIRFIFCICIIFMSIVALVKLKEETRYEKS